MVDVFRGWNALCEGIWLIDQSVVAIEGDRRSDLGSLKAVLRGVAF